MNGAVAVFEDIGEDPPGYFSIEGHDQKAANAPAAPINHQGCLFGDIFCRVVLAGLSRGRPIISLSS
jgi:hypothetical protein